MDIKLKKSIIMQNNYVCKFGALQNKTNYTSYKNFYKYKEDYNSGIPIDFCDVYVIKMHPLIIAKEIVNHGLNPAIVNLVSDKYGDSNLDSAEGVYDEILNLRSNYQTISKQNNNFPAKENESFYSPQVMIIRDELLNAAKNIFNVSFITITRVDKYEFILDKKSEPEKIFTVNTYIKLKLKIELIFQTAHTAKNPVIIFSDFGCLKDDLPVKQLVDIFNSCILDYGHCFKQIIFSLNVRTPQEQIIYNTFLEHILKPQDIINKDLEQDLEQDELLANIINLSK